MKLFRSSLLLFGEVAAFGWFIIQDLSFFCVLPLIPLGLLHCKFYHEIIKGRFALNAIFTAFSVILTSYVTAVGLFEGRGLFSLVCLSISAGLLGLQVPAGELERVSGWWLTGFLLVFAAMTVATVPGAQIERPLPAVGNWSDILIFYLLVFIEPMCLGKNYRCAPLALGILLVPFSLFAYFALGDGAFALAEYPYLSVWSGVSVSAFHHIEGIILCFYYGIGGLRAAHFFGHYKKRIAMQKVIF